MFVGHLAVALAAKPAAPTVSIGALIGAAFGLDLIWPLFVLAGLEEVRVEPGATAFTPLAFVSYPWSHSLLMSLVWGFAFGVAFWRWSRAALVIAALVVSHWVLDFVTHRPDLPLWIDGPRVGLGLWNSIPATLVVEGAVLIGGVFVYTRFTRPRSGTGRWALWSLLALCTAIWISGPFSPPPPSAEAVSIVAFALWLFPLWGHWIERHRVPRSAV
jgi:hypothetical protein